MQFVETNISGVWQIIPNVKYDNRGYFFESYKKDFFDNYISGFCPIQENISKSKKNVFRGIHLQLPPYEQAKLVQCIEGTIIDIVVDLRKDSKQYLEYLAIELSSENRKQLFIPRGFGHAFYVKSDQACILYKVDNIYSPQHERTVNYLNNKINIDFKTLGIDINSLILSERDKTSDYI